MITDPLYTNWVNNLNNYQIEMIAIFVWNTTTYIDDKSLEQVQDFFKNSGLVYNFWSKNILIGD
jgi:hypothetical protein